ncbi:MAG: hypothetical protein U1E27_14160 [Kiritimatiellia bacterium]|nr:hypothetical protein [Kiritimatiellia bacterium]
MRTIRQGMCFSLLLSIGLWSTPRAEAQTPRDPAASRVVYQDISEHLDPGGDLYLIANVDGLLEEWVGFWTDVIQAFPGANEEVGTPVSHIPDFLRKNGFYGLQGFGLSTVPREDGRNQIKFFLRRDEASAGLPLWKGLFGGASSAMDILSYVPADAVLAQTGSGEVAQLWKLIKNGIAEIGGAEAAAAFETQIAQSNPFENVTMDELIGSLAGETAFSLQLSPVDTFALPLGDTPVLIPQPSFLLVLAVNRPVILDSVRKLLVDQLGQELPELKIEDASGFTIPVPVPAPFPVAITLVQHGRYLLIGSTAEVVANALQARLNGNGLRTQPEFKELIPNAEREHNGLSFQSVRLGRAMSEIQSAALANQASGDEASAKFISVVQSRLARQMNPAGGYVTLQGPTGISVQGVSTSGGRDYLAAMTAFPIGLMAGVAVPAFTQARFRTRQNICVNNLRLIDSVKEQWAMENNAEEGRQPDISALSQYMRGSVLPTCPMGGEYELGPVGEPPTCTIPGHELPGF